MPTYITLIKWTSKGIEHIKESPARLDKVKAAVKAAGGEVKAFYMTMGQYDAVLIGEGPTDEAYAKIMLATASSGNVSTQTLKAFTEDEYRRILAGL
jgi:uncharacterized protein with GYD domain